MTSVEALLRSVKDSQQAFNQSVDKLNAHLKNHPEDGNRTVVLRHDESGTGNKSRLQHQGSLTDYSHFLESQKLHTELILKFELVPDSNTKPSWDATDDFLEESVRMFMPHFVMQVECTNPHNAKLHHR